MKATTSTPGTTIIWLGDVMTMPGVKIGEGAQIGPGTHIIQDVGDGKRVYVKQEIVVSD